MKASPWIITIAAVALAIGAGTFGRLQYRKAVAFEERSRLALAHERNAQVQVDLLEDALRKARANTARASARVAAVDAANPPDTSCAPNLAARDAVIQSQASEIFFQAGQIDLLQTSKDELRRALEARPKVYPRFVGPHISLGVFVGAVGVRADGRPAFGAGVGISVNVLGIRL